MPCNVQYFIISYGANKLISGKYPHYGKECLQIATFYFIIIFFNLLPKKSLSDAALLRAAADAVLLKYI